MEGKDGKYNKIVVGGEGERGGGETKPSPVKVRLTFPVALQEGAEIVV